MQARSSVPGAQYEFAERMAEWVAETHTWKLLLFRPYVQTGVERGWISPSSKAAGELLKNLKFEVARASRPLSPGRTPAERNARGRAAESHGSGPPVLEFADLEEDLRPATPPSLPFLSECAQAGRE